MYKIHQSSVSHILILFLFITIVINGAIGELIELTDRNLDKIIKDDERWVLQFYTPKCKVCSSFRPSLEKLSELPEEELGVSFKYGVVNSDENPHLVSRFMATRNPQYFVVDKKHVYSFTTTQTYSYLYEFLKYRRWKLFPVKQGYSDPFSKISYIYGYFNVTGYLLKKHVFIYIPPKIFYGSIISVFFSLVIYYAYRKHREFEEYINNFEKDMEEKYYNQCLKHGYDPFALIEEMDKKIKEKEQAKKLEMKKAEEEERNLIRKKIE